MSEFSGKKFNIFWKYHYWIVPTDIQNNEFKNFLTVFFDPPALMKLVIINTILQKMLGEHSGKLWRLFLFYFEKERWLWFRTFWNNVIIHSFVYININIYVQINVKEFYSIANGYILYSIQYINFYLLH